MSLIEKIARSLESTEAQKELSEFIGEHLRLEDDRLIIYYGGVEIELTEDEIYFKNRYFRTSLTDLYAAGQPNERVMELD